MTSWPSVYVTLGPSIFSHLESVGFSARLPQLLHILLGALRDAQRLLLASAPQSFPEFHGKQKAEGWPFFRTAKEPQGRRGSTGSGGGV